MQALKTSGNPELDESTFPKDFQEYVSRCARKQTPACRPQVLYVTRPPATQQPVLYVAHRAEHPAEHRADHAARAFMYYMLLVCNLRLAGLTMMTMQQRQQRCLPAVCIAGARTCLACSCTCTTGCTHRLSVTSYLLGEQHAHGCCLQPQHMKCILLACGRIHTYAAPHTRGEAIAATMLAVAVLGGGGCIIINNNQSL
jgi:hypothetical protein